MRFTRYPRWEPYEVTPRKLAAARRAVQREKDRYPLFAELLKHQTPEDRLASIAFRLGALICKILATGDQWRTLMAKMRRRSLTRLLFGRVPDDQLQPAYRVR